MVKSQVNQYPTYHFITVIFPASHDSAFITPKLSDSFPYERQQVAEDGVKNDLDRTKVNYPFSKIDPKRFLLHIE